MTRFPPKKSIHTGSMGHNPIDPAWSPHVIVSRRLREACRVHSSRLSELSTIDSSAVLPSEILDHDAVHPLAKIALQRSACPQPPLDDGITGGGSSVPCDVHFSGMNVHLNPLERAAPHRIVVPGNCVDDEVHSGVVGQSKVRGEDGTWDYNKFGEHRFSTWNAISALSSLCDEVEEIENTFQERILPSIILFSADDNAIGPAKGRAGARTAVFDEDAQKRRESELLTRMGEFLPALQLASNGAMRLQRLVKNMVIQLGGCSTPATIPSFFDGRETDTNKYEGKNDVDDTKSFSVGGRSGDNRNDGEEHSMQPSIFCSKVPLLLLGRGIGTAFRTLITVDSAIASNDDLQEAWVMYKDVVMEFSEEKRVLDNNFESFERMIVQLDFNFLASRSFACAIEQNFDPRGRFREYGFKMHDAIHSIILTLYGQYCELINTEQESTERLDCVGVYAMYVLYRRLLPHNVVPDQKLHKSLWSVFPAMCPVLALHGPLSFLPREFISVYAPYEAIKGCSADISDIHQESAALVLKWDGSFIARVDKIRRDALGWLAVADAELSSTTAGLESEQDEDDSAGDSDTFDLALTVSNMERATSCILHGIKILHSASVTLRGQLISHKALNLGHNTNHIPSYLSLFQVIKSIEKMLRVRRRSAVLAFQRATLQMIASNILKKFDKIRSFVDQYSSFDGLSTSEQSSCFTKIGACLSALEGILKGSSSFSPIRRYSIAFSVGACMDSMILETFPVDDVVAVDEYLKDLNEISLIEKILKKVCDCSFVYFYRDLFPFFFENLYNMGLRSPGGHTQLVLSALSDPEQMLKHAVRSNSDGDGTCLTGYQSYVVGLVREKIIHPISEAIEVDLRLAVHSTDDNQQVPQLNLDFNKRVARSILNVPPLSIFHSMITVKNEVEALLDKSFYNLCTLGLNDCSTYVEMRLLARERYGLNLLDPHLPDGGLNQSVDIIDILRDLNSFISKFNYTMIEQTFVERTPERGSKFLSTLNIICVTAFIVKHGAGIVGSAVDVSCSLLAKKFALFTQFLADDFIKSSFSKELRWLTNHRNDGNNTYPYSRASFLAYEAKKPGTSDSDLSPLNECRAILADIGNIIAFMRLLRTAERKMIDDGRPYVSNAPLFTDAKKIELSSAGVCTKEIVASILNPLEPDFVPVVVKLFKDVLHRSDKSIISGLFCMVPALSLSWMDASLQGKEMMHKKNITRDGYYTDDGFAIGLTFCLSSLNQIKQYQSLHWFKSVQNKYATDEEDLMEKESVVECKSTAKSVSNRQNTWFSYPVGDLLPEDNSEMKALKMMRKRLEGNKREMAMLFFSMHGAEAMFTDANSVTSDGILNE